MALPVPILYTPKLLPTKSRLRLCFAPRSSVLRLRRSSVVASLPLNGSILRDVCATASLLAGAYGLVSTFDCLTQRNIIQQTLSRKLVHILSGLLYVVSWPIFSPKPGARYFAALVPLSNCLRLIVYGLSLASDEKMVNSISREGNPNELLKGPLYYVLILMLSCLLFWRESPTGIISLAMMCGGDGVADVVGRRFGFSKIPYNPRKSWAGSISMFTFGYLLSLGLLYYFCSLDYLQLEWTKTIINVGTVSFLATLVESLPLTQQLDDNLCVPIVAIMAAYITFGY